MSAEAFRYHDVRRDYAGNNLNADAISANPMQAFRVWLEQALEPEREGLDANAMALATVDNDGWPDVRYVLLKEITDRGIIFYSDSTSAKGRQLAANSHAAVAFHWRSVDRQIRIRGAVHMAAVEIADAYWQRRPAASQASATASHQSSELADRTAIVNEQQWLQEQYPDGLPRPDRWRGYQLDCDIIEFWQGQPDRCHDRLQLTYQSGQWLQRRLSP